MKHSSSSETVDCAAAVDRLYELLDDELGPELEKKVRAHFEGCARCYPLYTFECNFRRFLLARTRVQGAPAALRRRIFEQIVLEGDDEVGR
jgi:anti-sigma factor (TIGR02949 family)